MIKAEATQTTSLKELLVQRITLQGPLTISDFMVEALQHPTFGYYNRSQIFGAKGDFVTAPEISQIFGELIGLWSAAQWLALGSPPKVAIVELGPGRGTLMVDFLRAAKQVPAFADAIDLHLVETSSSLRHLQYELLASFSPHWHKDITDLPQLPTILIANEFFDALPIRQFVKQSEAWQELMVTVGKEDGLDLALSNFLDPRILLSLGADPNDLDRVDFLELSSAQTSLASIIADHLHEVSGSALIIDYGYEKPEGASTLQAVRQHKKCAVLDEPGSADITALVNFAALEKQFTQSGLNGFGTVGQGPFLSGLGLDQRKEQLLNLASEDQALEIAAACERLTSDEQMGALFKAYCATTLADTPAGFAPSKTQQEV